MIGNKPEKSQNKRRLKISTAFGRFMPLIYEESINRIIIIYSTLSKLFAVLGNVHEITSTTDVLYQKLANTDLN